MISRRGLITGLVSFVAAPAIVKVSSLMPVKKIEIEFVPWCPDGWVPYNRVLLSLIRERTPEEIAYDICGVQPMTGALDGYDGNSNLTA